MCSTTGFLQHPWIVVDAITLASVVDIVTNLESDWICILDRDSQIAFSHPFVVKLKLFHLRPLDSVDAIYLPLVHTHVMYATLRQRHIGNGVIDLERYFKYQVFVVIVRLPLGIV